MSKRQLRDRLNYLINSKSSLIDYAKLTKTLYPNNIFHVQVFKHGMTIEESVDYVLNKIKNSNAPKRLMELLELTYKDIFPDEIYAPKIFNVFGCPLSTDIDVAIVVTTIMDEKILELNCIIDKLKTLGYDTTKSIDFIQIVLDERGTFCLSNIGSKETQNMIFHTYKYHKQMYPCIFNKPIEYVEPIDKIRTTSKYVIDNLEEFIDEELYKSDKDLKKRIYKNLPTRIECTNVLLQNYTITELNSLIKSLCVKIYQSLIAYEFPEHIPIMYSKVDLSRLISSLYKLDYANVVALVTRGKIGKKDLTEINTTFKNIVLLFAEKTKLIMENFLDFDNVIPLEYVSEGTNILLDEFIKSPLIPTELFVQTMQILNPNRHLNCMYIINSNYEKVKEYLDSDFISDHCDLTSQRSDEWLELINYYLCGKNDSLPVFNGTTYVDWITTYYGLVRGSSAEILMMEYCDYSKVLNLDVVKFYCGLLVESKTKGARGNCPDLLLIDKVTKKIIPVEMKCIVGELEYSRNLTREIKLAKLQLNSTKKLLNSFYYGFSLIVLMFVYQKNGNYVFDIRYGKFE